MSDFETELRQRLDAIHTDGLRRKLRRVDSPQGARVELDGSKLLNFSSNDYLGLTNHHALKEAAMKAVEKFGAGAGASRLICGSLAPFHELEETLAAWKGTEASLTFSTGYACALGTITALMGKDDVVVLDKLVHASIVDSAKLSGAKLRVFRHNDLNDLEAKLKWAFDTKSRTTHSAPRTLIVTESVFSMDGDLAPLLNIVELKEKYGAWLMVDEAHAAGLFGEHRRGLIEEFGLGSRVEIQMGTLGKALGASGGYICGSRALADLLVNRARSFIFSTAPVPSAAAAARAGIELIQSREGERRRQRLWSLVELLKTALTGGPWELPAVRSAILPLILGDERRAVAMADALREAGIFVPAIRYPTVARGQARLRFTVSAAHSVDDIEQLALTLASIAHSPSPDAHAPTRPT